MQVIAKSIAANVARINRELGGSHEPVYGDIVPGMEEEEARSITEVVIVLAPGSRNLGEGEYLLPNGLRVKSDSNGTFCKAEFAV